MATKTIVGSVTIHVPGKTFKPFKFSDSGVASEGKYDVVQVPPGTPVTIDADEADSLIERGLADLYVEPALLAPEPIAAPPKK